MTHRTPAHGPAIALAVGILGAALYCADGSLTAAMPATERDVAQPNEPTVTVLSQGRGRTILRFDSGPGPSLAGQSVLVRVPDAGRVDAEVVSCELDALAQAANESASHPGDSDSAGTDPWSHVVIGQPAIMRDLRLVRVTFLPLAPGDDSGVYARSLVLSVGVSAGRGVNERRARSRPRSPAFERLYRNMVVNYDRSGAAWQNPAKVRDPQPVGARYLIITADSYEDEIQPLAEWKHAKGMKAKVVSLSETGSTPEQIRTYIENAYFNWEIPPEYVLLVGDTEVLPGYQDSTYTDNYYAAIDGSDYLADLMVGRISADSSSEVSTQVAKILGYERTPVVGDPDWPTSASLLVREDYDDGDWIYYMNTFFIYDLMNEAGFAPIDTLFRRNGTERSDVYASVNAGRGFVNYRGQAWAQWLEPFDIGPEYTTNGWKLPVVVSATCGTGDYESDGFICERWVRAGTASSPRGSVAFFATDTAIWSSQELALRRGYVDEGFFMNVFSDSGRTLGEACVAAKLHYYQKTDDIVDYEGWNLLGDPELNLWTADPFELTVLHDEGTQVGESDFVVTVMRAGTLFEGACVACVKDPDVYAVGYTDAAGQVSLHIAPASPGTLAVTVTAKNAVPYEGTALVLESGPFIVYSDLTIDDSAGGNGDGHLNPGETAAVKVALANVGDQEATDVAATLRISEPHTAVTDSLAWYGNVPPDSVAWAVDPFEVTVAPDCPDGTLVPFALDVTYGGSGSVVLNPPPMEVVTGRLSQSLTVVEDPAPGGNGDGAAGAGEAVGLSVTLTNEGPSDLADVHGILSSLDPLVVVTSDHASFGDIPSGGSMANVVAPFLLSISPTAINGETATLSLATTADGGAYQYADTLLFDITVTASSVAAPTGPDAYGYYAYDIADSAYGPAPTFEWTDLAPPGPGTLLTEITDADAAVTSVPTIFAFKYYGTVYEQISINSNGFLAAGWSDYLYGDNSPIPDPHGPASMIAPFWDDLDPSAGGDIYMWRDVTDHRLMFQFDQVRRWGTSDTETFQVIILNETYYPTPTGDAMILVQYKDVSNPAECTVGIESAGQDDGIQWLYNGAYGPQAGPVADSTAILFTTIPPEDPDVTWLVLEDTVIDDDAGGNGDGRAQPGETLSLLLAIANAGGSDATDVTLVMSSAEATVSVSDSTASLPDIPAGQSAQASDPLVVTVSQAIADTVATLWTTITANGGSYSGIARLDLHIDLSEVGVPDAGGPVVFAFRPCYPNPFGSETTIRLTLPSPQRASVRIYNPAGQLVKTLIDAPLEAGTHLLPWDGTDRSGNHVASGVYFVRVEAGPNSSQRKVVVLR